MIEFLVVNKYFKSQEKFPNIESLKESVSKKFQFSYGKHSFRNFSSQPIFNQIGRKVTATPLAVISGVVKTTAHTALAILSFLPLIAGNPKPLVKYTIYIVYDLIETLGHVTTLFYDRLGLYLTEWTAFEKYCIEYWASCSKPYVPISFEQKPNEKESLPVKKTEAPTDESITYNNLMINKEAPKPQLSTTEPKKPALKKEKPIVEWSVYEISVLFRDKERVKQVSPEIIGQIVQKHAFNLDYYFFNALSDDQLKGIKLSEISLMGIKNMSNCLVSNPFSKGKTLRNEEEIHQKYLQFSQEEMFKWVNKHCSQAIDCTHIAIEFLNALNPEKIAQLDVEKISVHVWWPWMSCNKKFASEQFSHLTADQVQKGIKCENINYDQFEFLSQKQINSLNYACLKPKSVLDIWFVTKKKFPKPFCQLSEDMTKIVRKKLEDAITNKK